MKNLLFILMFLPLVGMSQVELLRVNSDSTKITFSDNKYIKAFSAADSAFVVNYRGNLIAEWNPKTTTDTIKVKALCSLDIAFSDSVISDDRLVSTFSTDLLEVRKISQWLAPEHVKYLSMGNKAPVASSLIVWTVKEIK